MGRLSFSESTDYAECVRKSKSVHWDVDEVFPRDTRLDFSRDFLPAGLVRHDRLDFLDERERRTLNQVMAKSYINLFFFVEEYIIRDVARLAEKAAGAEIEREALDRFASEERKHQELFRRFMDAFDRDFGHPCAVLDLQDRIASMILGNSPAAVLLTTLHLEIITQEHFQSSVAADTAIEPSMVRVLRHHWMEECQHANLDYLELKKIAPEISDADRHRAISEYSGILDTLHALLSMQAGHDITSLEVATGRTFPDQHHLRLQGAQHQGYTTLFITGGLDHPALENTVRDHFPEAYVDFGYLQAKYRNILARGD